MKHNVGSTDRIVRFVIAAAALVGSGVLGFGSVGGIILLVVAAIMALTGAVGTCPIYSLVGMNTCLLYTSPSPRD